MITVQTQWPSLRALVLALVALGASAWASVALAADLIPPDRPLPEVVDHYVDQKLAEKGVKPAPAASDVNLLRRLSLDLAGRIPTPMEAQEYAANTDPQKKEKAVDRLLASEGFARQQYDELATLLMYPERDRNLEKYLKPAVAENRRWDQIFRDLMMPQGQAKAPEGAQEFLRAFARDADQVTNEVSVRFFGVNVSCAKCHDHPLVDAWTQDHFYGMKSFFERTFEMDGFVGEREYGLVSFSTTEGVKRDAKLMFLTGQALDEPEQKEPSEDEKKEQKKRLEDLRKKKEPFPAANYSRRSRILEVGLGEDGRKWFARAIANRLFHRFYGQGLVMPLDQMHAENQPSHPELLDWLARDLIEHQFDLKHTIRGLVLSNAYARDSRWAEAERPPASLFAVANVRPLTPTQLGAAVRMALNNPKAYRLDQPEEYTKRIEQLASGGRGWADKFEMPREDFQISVNEAMFFSNNERALREIIDLGLAGRLKELADDNERVTAAYWNVLQREPDDEERKVMLEYLSARGDRAEEAYRQMVWSLVTCTEFRFNY